MESQLVSERESISQLQEQLNSEVRQNSIEEIAAEETGTDTCECCGKDDVKETELVRIDSGQLFCSQCLHTLRSA